MSVMAMGFGKAVLSKSHRSLHFTAYRAYRCQGLAGSCRIRWDFRMYMTFGAVTPTLRLSHVAYPAAQASRQAKRWCRSYLLGVLPIHNIRNILNIFSIQTLQHSASRRAISLRLSFHLYDLAQSGNGALERPPLQRLPSVSRGRASRPCRPTAI